MTSTEATLILEHMVIDLGEAWAGLSETDPMKDVLLQRMMAVDLATKVLKCVYVV